MKTKSLIIILVVVLILLVYNLFCYGFANKIIDTNSKNIITNYFDNINVNSKYKYIKATSNEDSSINVFVYINDTNLNHKYYRFILDKYNGDLKIREVNNDIPIYIK